MSFSLAGNCFADCSRNWSNYGIGDIQAIRRSAEIERNKMISAANEKVKSIVQPYIRDVIDTKGMRLLLRNESDWEKKQIIRYLGFWQEIDPNNLPLFERQRQRLVEALGRDYKEPKFSLEIWGGIDHILNSPVRVASRKLADLNVIDKQKHLSVPALLVLSVMAIDYPLGKLREYNQAEDSKDELIKRPSIYRSVILQLNKELKSLSNMRKKGVPEETIQILKEAIFAKSLLDVKKFKDAYDDFTQIAKSFEQKYLRLEGGDSKTIDKQRVKALLKNPLFENIPAKLGIKSEADLNTVLADSNGFNVVEGVVTSRELLFLENSLLPTLIKGGEKLKKLRSKKGTAKILERLENNAFYTSLKSAYDKKTIDYNQFHYALMEDAFWRNERFSVWRLLAYKPKKIIAGKESSELLTINDIRIEIISKLKKEQNMTNPALLIEKYK